MSLICGHPRVGDRGPLFGSTVRWKGRAPFLYFPPGDRQVPDPKEQTVQEKYDDILVAEGVQKVYRTGAGSVAALVDLDLRIRPGEFLAVMGPSGSGKTTLLNCLSGLDNLDGGRVIVEGLDIHGL